MVSNWCGITEVLSAERLNLLYHTFQSCQVLFSERYHIVQIVVDIVSDFDKHEVEQLALRAEPLVLAVHELLGTTSQVTLPLVSLFLLDPFDGVFKPR